jgi:hypothetical protein
VLARLRSRRPSHATVVAYLALFVALGGTGAYAANTVFSTDIVDGEVKTPDLASGAATQGKLAANSVTTAKVVDDSLGGADILESSLAQVPNAGKLNGMGASAYVQGGSAAACCYGKSTGKAYFNRIPMVAKASFLLLEIPGILHINGTCGDSTVSFAATRVAADTPGLELYYHQEEGGAGQTAHAPVPVNSELQFFTESTKQMTIQAGVGRGTRTGQKLVTITAFESLDSNGECFFQVSALSQAT